MHTQQKEIIHALQVKDHIDVEEEIRSRVNLLKAYLKKSGLKGYVLGISGGQDSCLAGKLISIAITELNDEEENGEYHFVAVRLPYGVQADEDDAQLALKFVEPTKQITVDIKPAVEASNNSFHAATGEWMSDYVRGNTKARERMKVQFDLAAHYSCLVVGTDHAAEAVTGFYTKFGDGACDITPLFGLSKRQGKALLKALKGPQKLIEKAPTADLEDDRPQLADEEALGLTYEQIDDYLEGKEIEEDAKNKLEDKYRKTEHKRQLPITPADYWWQS
ncbi:ammonia-dependent NAD(+) synthetase [Paenalkalicoccus suaedae]|uniref:NH(3)-dependent NAD(+) synthetase n=1 Tax=Paenalkalicoccus suaedae TaxID=2592382 RepID=A0A859FDQ0_9BACI|nr:ammonia-dependent NAD(+) synthetase [Paenalkalicoccus suaedae]QKS71329.1 ammonia-dependent NAD(+) synthetase [Paenalkalicoccus suaedae]